MGMHKTRIDIPQEQRQGLVKLLNARLADAIDLSYQAKQAHWNVKGPHFIGLHELFDKIHEVVEGHVDTIAERLTALGGTAEGTVHAVAKKSALKPYPLDIVTCHDHVVAMADALAAFGKNVREAIDQADELNDADTADLFTEVSRDIDQHLWFVEAHVQADR